MSQTTEVWGTHEGEYWPTEVKAKEEEEEIDLARRRWHLVDSRLTEEGVAKGPMVVEYGMLEYSAKSWTAFESGYSSGYPKGMTAKDSKFTTLSGAKECALTMGVIAITKQRYGKKTLYTLRRSVHLLPPTTTESGKSREEMTTFYK